MDPDVCDDSHTPLPLFEDGTGRFSKISTSELGKKGEDGPGEIDDEEVEPGDEAWAFVLQLSGTSMVQVGWVSGS